MMSKFDIAFPLLQVMATSTDWSVFTWMALPRKTYSNAFPKPAMTISSASIPGTIRELRLIQLTLANPSSLQKSNDQTELSALMKRVQDNTGMRMK
jgi:hypothetical protein